MNNIWDQLSLHHYNQLKEEKDITFHKIFIPVINGIINANGEFHTYTVLDLGCGTGYLTRIISSRAYNVLGIDTSSISIEIAKSHNKDLENVEFKCSSVEEYSNTHTNLFDFVISHLVLHVIENIETTIMAVSNILKKDKLFVFSIPHPCFWALSKDIGTWNILMDKSKTRKYKYSVSSTYQNIIKINELIHYTPYFHRSLETYSSILYTSGFAIERIIEPMPDDELMKRYNKKRWRHPRFIFLVCRKIR